jgi:hypothetical protein
MPDAGWITARSGPVSEPAAGPLPAPASRIFHEKGLIFGYRGNSVRLPSRGLASSGGSVMKRLRSVMCLALLMVPAFCITTVPGLAQPLQRSQFQTSFDVGIKHFCGDLHIRLAFSGHGTLLLNSHGPDGLAYGVETLHGTESYTNLANDRTLTTVYNVPSKDLTVTDNGDGTLTVIAMTTGSVKVYDPEGELLFIDSGQMRVKLLIDDGGTPRDPSDDQVSADLGTVKGSTGRNDLQTQDFCANIHEFIG